MPRPPFSSPEPLEPRIAPAGLLKITGGGKVASWDDADGDHVTLTASKAVLVDTEFHFLETAVGKQLARLDLDATAKGVSFTFTAKRDSALHLGDGSVNVGRIAATGVDLGAISIPGDLGSIYAGDSDLATPAVKSLKVRSAGIYQISNQDSALTGTAPNLGWVIEGKLGPVTVKGDFRSALEIRDSLHPDVLSANASAGTITISGSIKGDLDTYSPFVGVGTGYIHAQGSLGAVIVHGNVDALGSTSVRAGSITAIGAIASVAIDGNLIGGSANTTGCVVADGALGPVTVLGTVHGGVSPLGPDGDVAKDAQGQPIFIKVSGAIGSSTSIGAVKIGSLQPGYGVFSGAIYTTFGTAADIKSVTVTGTLGGYRYVQTQDLTAYTAYNGIYADGQLGPVVAGSVQGADESNGVPIAALGLLKPGAQQALAIASVTVKHGADSMLVLAGYTSLDQAVNPDVQIGPIKVADNLVRSNIVAGIKSPTAMFGAADNALIQAPAPYDNPAIRSRIASLTVGGSIVGSSFSNYITGAVAQEIGSVKVGEAKLELSATTGEVFALGVAPGFFVREVGA